MAGPPTVVLWSCTAVNNSIPAKLYFHYFNWTAESLTNFVSSLRAQEIQTKYGCEEEQGSFYSLNKNIHIQVQQTASV